MKIDLLYEMEMLKPWGPNAVSPSSAIGVVLSPRPRPPLLRFEPESP
jgi:hypothetical protein